MGGGVYLGWPGTRWGSGGKVPTPDSGTEPIFHLPPYPGLGGPPGDPWFKETFVDVGSLNKQKKSAERQAQVAGINNPIPIIYGRQRVGARIAAAVTFGGKLYLLCVWCLGEIDAIESIQINGKEPDSHSSLARTDYLGTDTQVPDPWLVTAFAAEGIVYEDSLPGVCYSVFRIKPADNDGFPRFTAQIRGMKVRPTQNGTRAWSQNPALCLADFIESEEYGWGKQCDWDTVADAADACDELVGGEARRQLDIAIDGIQETRQWVAIMRDYAGCWVVPEGGVYRLVPDIAGASVADLDGTNIIAGTESFGRRSARDAPTVVAVDFTDTSGEQYKDRRVYVSLDGVSEGTVPRRVSAISRPGTTRYSEAVRYATERLNEALLNDVVMECVVDDSALALQVGDIVSVTHTIGFTDKLMRIMRIASVEPGRWGLRLVEYSADRYSDQVATDPGQNEIDLPSPSYPEAVTGLALSEEFYLTQDGSLASRIQMTWDATDYPFLDYYLVECFDGSLAGTRVFAANTATNAFVTPPIKEGRLYAISVKMVTISGAHGDPDTESITPLGKLALPVEVPSFSVYSVNGETHANWERPNDIDISGYELRWSAQSGTWEDATLLARVAAPALSYSTTTLPPGALRLWIKSLDSVTTDLYPNGQESANANFADFTATASSTSNTSEYEPGALTLTNMVAVLGGYVTAASSDNWNTLFGSALNTYTDPLFTYHASVTASLVTSTADLLTSALTTVFVDMVYEDLTGAAQVYIEHKVNSGDSWTRVDGNTASVTARYFRWGIETTTTETVFVSDVGVLRATRDETQRFVKDTVLNDAIAWML